MKKIISAALAAAAFAGFSGVAHADPSFSGSVNLTTDYLFRGISQSDGNAAIQGSLDFTNDAFYAGVWGSSINFGAVGPTDLAQTELDFYAGFKPVTGPVTWDLGVIAYTYPGSTDLLGEFDYYEGKVAATFAPTEQLSLTGAVYYSPDFTLETGTGIYAEVSGSYALSEQLSLIAAYGHQDVDDIGDYNTWNIGAKYALHGFTLGATYSDSDAFDEGFVGDETLSDGRFVLSIGRAL